MRFHYGHRLCARWLQAVFPRKYKVRYADDAAKEEQWSFQHLVPASEQVNLEEKKRTLSREHLVNRLNFINFQNGTITVNFRHKKFGSTISLQANPLPCLGNSLYCTWVETENIGQKLRMHKALSFVIPDKQKFIQVEAEIGGVDERGINFLLPESFCEISSRSVKRHCCEGIQVQLIQHGTIFYGFLLDFSAVSFRIEVSAVPPQSFQWVNSDSPVQVIFQADNRILYSGECGIIRQNCGQYKRVFVLKPLQDAIRRFNPKQYRSKRHKLVPSPNIIFTDPFTQRTVDLKVIDLSGSGFSVEEDENSSILLPGKIIPELFIDFAGILRIRCKAQVVYRSPQSDGNGRGPLRCGLAILDMEIQDHIKLLSLLYQADNRNSYICGKVDLDSLWEFFFETGFVYPSKYAYIQGHKEKFRKTYERLYTQNPHIARHFIYQDKGTIYAHMAMFRFFENTWLIHHHAARKSSANRAGLIVLDQLSRSINDSHSLYSARMNFVSCYYRPANKFPSRVFGGLARFLNNPKGCSVDDFAYLHFRRKSDQWSFPGPWTLEKTTPEDLAELESWYEFMSGGLLLHSQDLEPGMIGQDTLSEEYRKLGFKKEKQLLSLKKEGSLEAVISVSISDVGLNLSELTNCTTVFVLDEENLTADALNTILALISVKYENNEMSVLIYPSKFADKKSISYEKTYTYFVLNLQYLDHWFKYCEKLSIH